MDPNETLSAPYVTVTISTGGAAFRQEDRTLDRAEVARLLRQAADRIAQDEGRLLDYNGNTAGGWIVAGEEEVPWYIADQQGATFAFREEADRDRYAAAEAAGGAVDLTVGTFLAHPLAEPYDVATLACSRGFTETARLTDPEEEA